MKGEIGDIGYQGPPGLNGLPGTVWFILLKLLRINWKTQMTSA